MIRASMRASEKVSGWPIEVRYFWTQLWGYCDDFGRGRYDHRLIKADTFPLDDAVTPDMVGEWMRALETATVIEAYEVAGKRYFECINWHEHQELPYFRRSDIPDQAGQFPSAGKRSEIVQKVPENSPRREGKGREIEGKGMQDTRPPRRCPDHINSRTSPNCFACRDARLAQADWDAAQKNKPTPTAPPAPNPDTCRHVWTDNYCAKCLTRKEDTP